MVRVWQFFVSYCKKVFKLIFSCYLWVCWPYSLYLLVPNQLFSFSRHRQNAFISLVNKSINYIKAQWVNDNYQISIGNVQFIVPYLVNDIIEISRCFITIKDSKVIKCLDNPYFFEGPYITDHCYLKPGDLVLDVGANLGLFSVFAALEVGPTGRVLAFEPNERAVNIMRDNLRLNNINNVDIFYDVLTDQIGEVDFHIDLDGTFGASSIFTTRFNKVLQIKAQQNTIDRFVREHNIERIDFIKADIEGAERLMLKGAEETIKHFKPTIAIRIYHFPDDPEVIENILREYVPEYRIEKFGRKTLYAYLER